jgi:hypothetical protein
MKTAFIIKSLFSCSAFEASVAQPIQSISSEVLLLRWLEPVFGKGHIS